MEAIRVSSSGRDSTVNAGESDCFLPSVSQSRDLFSLAPRSLALACSRCCAEYRLYLRLRKDRERDEARVER